MNLQAFRPSASQSPQGTGQSGHSDDRKIFVPASASRGFVHETGSPVDDATWDRCGAAADERLERVDGLVPGD